MLAQLLLALAAVVIVGRLLGSLFRRADQPPAIGEVLGGILLGPSFLGLVSPAAYNFILPSENFAQWLLGPAEGEMHDQEQQNYEACAFLNGPQPDTFSPR